MLSEDQQRVLQQFNRGHNIFMTGPGGTGKSFLIKYLKENATRPIKVTAMTGTAAILLNCEASTIHSWSGIKLARGTHQEVINYAYGNSFARKNWKNTQILIIDEVSMMSQKIFEILEELARTIKKSLIPFGGMQIICCGDFYQLPPVGNDEEPLTNNFCFESPLWSSVFSQENHIELRTNFRQSDPLYKLVLSKVRTAEIDEETIETLTQCLYKTPPNHLQLTKLFPTLSLVAEENNKNFSKLDADIYRYEYHVSDDNTHYSDSGFPIPAKIVQQCKAQMKHNPQIIDYEVNYIMTNSNKCCKVIELKKGAFVMSTINLNLDLQICNGSQGVIVDFVNVNGMMLPRVEFYNGITANIEYHKWQSEAYPTISVEQIPLCLAWAMSIHKSQGATLAYAEIDIGNSIFADGQVYVALSRVKSLDGLYITHFNPHKITANEKVADFYANFSVTK